MIALVMVIEINMQLVIMATPMMTSLFIDSPFILARHAGIYYKHIETEQILRADP